MLLLTPSSFHTRPGWGGPTAFALALALLLHAAPGQATSPPAAAPAAAGSAAATAAATSASAPVAKGTAATSADQARQALLNAASEGACSQDAQCRTLPVGTSPCGGPALWLVYANQPGQEQRLKTLAQALTRAEQAERTAQGQARVQAPTPAPRPARTAASVPSPNAGTGPGPSPAGPGTLMGLCALLPAPQARCVAGHCTGVAPDLLLR